jgi:hypothetical protein
VKELYYLYPRQGKGTSAYHQNIMQHAVIKFFRPRILSIFLISTVKKL